jgi:hypothetical protein
MARKMKKFSAGGAQGKYDRRMADIEKDFKKDSSGKTGKAAEVLAAKRAQRIADAKDDLAKRTGADRTATRAAERAAEDTLRSTRRQGKSLLGVESFMKSPEFSTKVASEKAPAAPAEAKPTTTSTASKPASKPAVKKVVTPTAKPKPSAADIARQKTKIGASNAPSDQGFSRKSKVLGASNRSGATGTGAPATGGTALRGRPMTGGLFSNLFTTSDAYRKSQEAKYGKAKGGKIMKYAKGGSTPPKPSDADRARSKKHLDELKKLKPTAEEGKVAGSANRSEGPGYKKGGKMATKFGAAMKKKSADTKGRAMPKFAKGGSIDGCAVKGKTKTSMVKMKNGGSC